LVVIGAFGHKFGDEGRWFKPTSSHEGTLGKSFTQSCLYDVMLPCVAALQLNSTLVIVCYQPFILYL